MAFAIQDSEGRIRCVHNGARRFVTASMVKVDILACLLLRRQDTGGMTEKERRASSTMIRDSDNHAASELWNDIGRGPGFRDCLNTFGLRQTEPGPHGYWGLTTTTVSDRIRMLSVLTRQDSPLRPDSRRAVLELMTGITSSQRWGISAAADEGTSPALKNGWLRRDTDRSWVVNSFGWIQSEGRHLMVAALCDGQPSLATGISTIEKTVRAAVDSDHHRYTAPSIADRPIMPSVMPFLMPEPDTAVARLLF
ncbi:serine hydrolase [Streptomyces pathocidini]|uniref:serine hydrolase n=1 Tax=Streptomyces pathocidini TaxID=1650571 RepID=UPI0033DBB056